jgi:hypothetical protein
MSTKKKARTTTRMNLSSTKDLHGAESLRRCKSLCYEEISSFMYPEGSQNPTIRRPCVTFHDTLVILEFAVRSPLARPQTGVTLAPLEHQSKFEKFWELLTTVQFICGCTFVFVIYAVSNSGYVTPNHWMTVNN